MITRFSARHPADAAERAANGVTSRESSGTPLVSSSEPPPQALRKAGFLKQAGEHEICIAAEFLGLHDQFDKFVRSVDQRNFGID